MSHWLHFRVNTQASLHLRSNSTDERLSLNLSVYPKTDVNLMDGTTVSGGSVTDPVLDIEVPIDAIFDPDE